MGRLFTDAFMDYCPDCDVAFYNGGGFLAGLTYQNGGNVTKGDIIGVAPFQNNVRLTPRRRVWLTR